MTDIKTPCPDQGHMGEFACDHHEQCWEPCGALGHSAEHVRVFTQPSTEVDGRVAEYRLPEPDLKIRSGDYYSAKSVQKLIDRAILTGLKAMLQEFGKPAEKYFLLQRRGMCDSKHGNGLVIGDRDKATVAFRYWCTPEQLDALLEEELDREDNSSEEVLANGLTLEETNQAASVKGLTR